MTAAFVICMGVTIALILLQSRHISRLSDRLESERSRSSAEISALRQKCAERGRDLASALAFARSPQRDWEICEGWRCFHVCRSSEGVFVDAATLPYGDDPESKEYARRCAEELRDMLNLDIAPRELKAGKRAF